MAGPHGMTQNDEFFAGTVAPVVRIEISTLDTSLSPIVPCSESAAREPTAGLSLPSLDATWDSVPLLRESLSLLEDALCELVSSDSSRAVQDVAFYLIRAGGKRLRPALFFLSGQTAGGDPTVLIRLAASVEMLHVATLYHDDLIDGALSRRGQPTSHRRWGNRASALGGTYLIARSMDLIAEHGAEFLELVSSAVTHVWRGQMRELEGLFSLDRTEQAYFESVTEKTASFFEMACAMGAAACGAQKPLIDALSAYGRYLGIAFQIVDDILDLTADTERMGKPVGADVRMGVYTLPVIHGLATQSPGTRLRQLLEQDPMPEASYREVVRELHTSGAIDYALRYAFSLVERAVSVLRPLPQGPAVKALGATARAVLQRPEFSGWKRGSL
jgi:heptaprenyl diphosphate synthase